MYSNAQYEKIKERDMAFAQSIYDGIQKNTHPSVKYKDSRPIMNIKHMMETSCSDEWYGNNIAFRQKFKKGGEYEAVTFKEAFGNMNALGTALIAAGMKDKKIAVIGENSYEWAIAYLSAVCGTGVVVPIDKELNPAEIEQLLIKAKVSCVLFKDKHREDIKSISHKGKAELELLINLDASEKEGDIRGFGEILEEGRTLISQGDKSFTEAEIDAEELAILLFTSGTTGVSKGVMLNHRNIITDLMVAPTVVKVNDWDIFFSILPVHHAYECTCGFLMPLYKGASIAYCEGLKQITKNLEEVKPTMFLGVPLLFETLYSKIWKNVRKKGKEKLLKRVIKINRKTKKVGIDLGNIFMKEIRKVFGGNMRMMICGGAAINPEVLDGIKDFGIMALQGYGLTECAPMGALNPDSAPKSNSIGRAFPTCDIRIDNPNEEGIGEICIQGGNVMMGYFEMPEATAEVIKDGWFHTGDLGCLDDEGYAYITGRKKNVIITKNGKNVYPEELEYYLSNSQIILEAMVFDQDSEDGKDTLIVASIRVDEEELETLIGKNLSDEEIIKALWNDVDKINEEQPFFKKIKKIILRKQEFEKNTSKKIIRYGGANRDE